MPSLRTCWTVALGAVTLVAGVVTGGGRTASAFDDAPAPPAHAHHADSIVDAQRWSDAGQSIAAATTAATWCGDFRADDNLTNEVLQDGPKWHMVIAVPRDVAASPVYQNAGRQVLADDAFTTIRILDNFYRQRIGVGNIGESALGWKLRFDYGTNCGSQYPDISFYHLPRTTAQYTEDPFFNLQADLDASNKYERTDRRYVVHYVGPAIYCGQSYIYDPTDASGGVKYSMVYNFDRALDALQDVATSPSTAGVGFNALCDWSTDAHEIGHSIGAATGGPANNDGAHTWDCYNDVMSYGGPVCGDGVLYFDWMENNYFDHPGAWYDTRQSAYWCKPFC